MVWSNLLITLYTWLPPSDFPHLLDTMIIITTIIILIVMIMLIIIVISSSSLGAISTSPRADPPPTSTPSPVPYLQCSRWGVESKYGVVSKSDVLVDSDWGGLEPSHVLRYQL